MSHLQYMPGDPRLVDQLVYELKSKGIFDQFRKDCIADVDTRPAYQNLRQRVENSVSTFLSRQTWQPDLNKNQLREKLRKHILDGNYLEQGVERIVDQVVNPKVASVFIPKVEDLVYNYLGITKKKSPVPETSNGKIEDLLPNDLEAVSPGSVNEDKNESMEVDGKENSEMEIDEVKQNSDVIDNVQSETCEETTADILLPPDVISDDKIEIPLPAEEIKMENIPEPKKMEVEKIELPKEPIISTDIPLPDDIPKEEKDDYFKPINSDDDDSSSDSSIIRNMSPLTPIRNYNNENSYDAQQAFENDSVEDKTDEKKEPNIFRFTIEAKSPENSSDVVKSEKKQSDNNLAYRFNNQVNINTPVYEDSSNSNILHIDYESDANSKANIDNKVIENDQNSKDSKRESKSEEKRNSHKSSHRSHKQSSSKEKRSDSKSSSLKDSRQDKSKSSKDDSKSKSSDKERSRDRSDKKDSRDSSRHRSSHKSHKDSKSHRSSSSSQRHSSKSDDKKTSSQKERERDRSDKSKDSKSSSQRSDKDRKSSSKNEKSKSKHDDKDKDKKNKKDTDDHYSVSGRGNPNRRSTDRDSNDGSSSSKGSHNPSSSKSTNGKKDSKSSSKSETTSTSGESTSPSDKENVVHEGTTAKDLLQHKPIVRIEGRLETPMASPPRLPFVPDVTIRKPKFAANLEEAKRLMKMRKFLDEEQKRMNQEAALLLEFQANVRPSLSQVYSNIPGPELEFACIMNSRHTQEEIQDNDNKNNVQEPHYTNNQLLTVLNNEYEDEKSDMEVRATTSTEPIAIEVNKGEPTPTLSQNIQDDIYRAVNENIEDEHVENSSTIHNTQTNTDKKEIKYIDEENLRYFNKNEQYDAEIEIAKFTSFFIEYKEKTISDKLYLINCDPYEENIVRDVSKKFGKFEIVNYIKNGHLKLPATNVVKNVNISTEISLPIEADFEMNGSESPKSQIFSPGKSECSFDLSSDYDAKLTEMVNKTSRQEVMEIILGSALDSSTKMPTIDYFTDSNIEAFENSMKRKMSEETTVNNNIHVLTPNKIRKLSTDQITSTTEEIEEIPTNKSNCTRSKYLGKARRVGLPRPRKTLLPNSPSSDKSVENYEQNTPTQSPNGKIKRNKVQRYDTSDLYKPKLHFLSRRNHHIT
ncbi:unnamed protein product [Danaus chrysippus]|uniref:(African queen) hypothetical protein n=1 Tax=Danaus chrysippus TaxID=151541 RepID=A0A8J2QR80_9NEOP|nr:unnamed protein product [Danaus chrysippus]